jgi:hypothetical protein
MAEQSSSSVMCAFRADLENQAVLNVRAASSAGFATKFIVAPGATIL